MKLKFIDSIRGIAILMVILVHTSQRVSDLDSIATIIARYGQMGVQLFFIASAYTLCLSSMRRESESLPLVKYSIRRFFRIAPAYYLGFIVYLVLSLILSKFLIGEFNLPNKYNLANILSNLFFVHGFYPPANNNIVPGGWSIGTEMAFYAIFPVLFFIAQAKLRHNSKNLLMFIASGIILSQLCLGFLSFFGYKMSNNTFIYYNLINQLPVFLLGIVYFFFKRDFHFKLNWIYSLLFFLIFTIISILLWKSGIKYFFAIIPIVSGVSFIFLFEIFEKFDFLNRKLLIRIGQVSYSMYLLHFIFAHLLTGLLAPRFVMLKGTISLLVFYVFSVLLTFVLALLSEKYIEKPGVELGKKLIKKIDIHFTNRDHKTLKG